MTEILVRQRVAEWTRALRAKDLDAIMSFYAAEIVSFDLEPPLRYAGLDAKRQAWQRLFASFTGPIDYEMQGVTVTTSGDLAFVHSLNHVRGTLVGGHASNLWVRWTACFRCLAGDWAIVHDHVSVPADVPHGRARLDLTP